MTLAFVKLLLSVRTELKQEIKNKQSLYSYLQIS